MPESDETAARAEIVRVARRLYDRGLIAGAEGTVSCRLVDGWLLTTPAGACKGDLTAAEIVAIDIHGVPRDPRHRPSTEVRMHLRVYQRRPDVWAVVHAHPPVATGFAVAGEDFMAPILPELIVSTGPVPLVPYGQPGTEALADRLDPYLDDHDAFLLANHGATTLGDRLVDALHRMEALEHGARIVLAARQLGRVRALDEDAAEALRGIRRAGRPR